MKAEAKKCKLLCILCHSIKTTDRYVKSTIYKPREVQKIEYVKAKKVKIGTCQICRLAVNPNYFSYFEYDHLDSSKKRESISIIATHTYAVFTMEYLIEEMEKCRILCAFCHKLRTNIQAKQRNATIREAKMAKLAAAVDASKAQKRERNETLEIDIRVRLKLRKNHVIY